LVAEQVAAITSDDRLIRSDDQPEWWSARAYPWYGAARLGGDRHHITATGVGGAQITVEEIEHATLVPTSAVLRLTISALRPRMWP